MTGKEVVRHELSPDGPQGATAEAPAPFGQGVAVDLTAIPPKERHRAFREACDYRGDVTLEMVGGELLECFIFDWRMGTASADGCIRVMGSKDGQKQSIACAAVRRLTFSGKDTAAGKTWEAWVKRYIQKRTAGESASIESEDLS